MGFSRQEYWSGLPGPPPGDLPNPGIKPRSPTLQADSFLTEDHSPYPNAKCLLFPNKWNDQGDGDISSESGCLWGC